MTRYIDADKFEKECMFDKNCNDMQDVIYKLRDYPAADVRENVHAKKVIGGGEHDGSTCWFECSHCHGTVDLQDMFCKHCGAVLEYEKGADT